MTNVKTGVKMSPMTPNAPKTPVSNFRIPADLKAKAQAKAASEGKTLTDVVVEQLTKYTKGVK